MEDVKILYKATGFRAFLSLDIYLRWHTSPRHLQVYQLCDWDRSQLCFRLILTRAMRENHPKCCTNATEISQSPQVPPTMRAMRGQHRLFLPGRLKFQRPTPFFDRRKPKEIRWNKGLSSCLPRNFLETFIFSNLTQKGPPNSSTWIKPDFDRLLRFEMSRDTNMRIWMCLHTV